MKVHEVRARIPYKVFKEYKIICAKLDISIPKQLANMIQNFVDVQESNEKMMRHLQDKNKS